MIGERMWWIQAIVNRIKFLIITIVDLLRYVCCIKKNRRRPSTDFVPLSSVGVVSNDKYLQISNEDDVRAPFPNSIGGPPKNVQSYIEEYRQQKLKQMTSQTTEEIPPDYFQDMVPKIVQQQKVFVKQKDRQISSPAINSRLAFTPISTTTVAKGNELANWEEMENTGSWDVDEMNTGQMLREERQLERERRMIENSKKRLDKERSRMGSKIS